MFSNRVISESNCFFISNSKSVIFNSTVVGCWAGTGDWDGEKSRHGSMICCWPGADCDAYGRWPGIGGLYGEKADRDGSF